MKQHCLQYTKLSYRQLLSQVLMSRSNNLLSHSQCYSAKAKEVTVVMKSLCSALRRQIKKMHALLSPRLQHAFFQES